MGRAAVGRGALAHRIVERWRVLVVAGVASGLVAGVGARLAMGVLRVTSPPSMRGVITDDDAVIGPVTVAGTYAVLTIGVGVGLIGTAVYGVMARWLIGPRWFRRTTVGLGCGAVIGSMFLHAEGVDFTRLEPVGLSMVLFIALPAACGVATSVLVDRVASTDSWTRRGPWSWVLPLALLAAFPPVVPVAVVLAAGAAAWTALGAFRPIRGAADQVVTGVVVRGAWLAVAIAGLLALIADISDILTTA